MAKGESYEQFIEKSQPKRTTDDCYTPPPVYEALLQWAAAEVLTPLDIAPYDPKS